MQAARLVGLEVRRWQKWPRHCHQEAASVPHDEVLKDSFTGALSQPPPALFTQPNALSPRSACPPGLAASVLWYQHYLSHPSETTSFSHFPRLDLSPSRPFPSAVNSISRIDAARVHFSPSPLLQLWSKPHPLSPERLLQPPASSLISCCFHSCSPPTQSPQSSQVNLKP